MKVLEFHDSKYSSLAWIRLCSTPAWTKVCDLVCQGPTALVSNCACRPANESKAAQFLVSWNYRRISVCIVELQVHACIHKKDLFPGFQKLRIITLPKYDIFTATKKLKASCFPNAQYIMIPYSYPSRSTTEPGLCRTLWRPLRSNTTKNSCNAQMLKRGQIKWIIAYTKESEFHIPDNKQARTSYPVLKSPLLEGCTNIVHRVVADSCNQFEPCKIICKSRWQENVRVCAIQRYTITRHATTRDETDTFRNVGSCRRRHLPEEFFVSVEQVELRANERF